MAKSGSRLMSLNLKNRELDEKVIIDICSDRNGFLVVGCETGYSYTAQVEIPAREYTQTEAEDDFGEPYINLEPVPFDIEKCTLYLWGDR